MLVLGDRPVEAAINRFEITIGADVIAEAVVSLEEVETVLAADLISAVVVAGDLDEDDIAAVVSGFELVDAGLALLIQD